MSTTVVCRHSYLGGPEGPPDIDTVPAYSPWIPIVDPEKVRPTASAREVYIHRLNPDELRAVQELLGREPMGRYGNYEDRTDTFWSFGPRDELRKAMKQLRDKVSEMRAAASPAIHQPADGSKNIDPSTPSGDAPTSAVPTDDTPFANPATVWFTKPELFDSARFADVCCYRLNTGELRAVQGAMGREPLGRYCDYEGYSDCFWHFQTQDELTVVTNRCSALLTALRPSSPALTARYAPRTAYDAASKVCWDSWPDRGRPSTDYLDSGEQSDLAAKLDVSVSDLLQMDVCESSDLSTRDG